VKLSRCRQGADVGNRWDAGVDPYVTWTALKIHGDGADRDSRMVDDLL
jgi:hypothetical protein